MNQFAHFFVAISVLIGKCSETDAYNCTNRVDGAPCGTSVCHKGSCLPGPEGDCYTKKPQEFCSGTPGSSGYNRCLNVGYQGLLSCLTGDKAVEYWNKNQCTSASEGDSCTVKEYLSIFKETRHSRSIFGEAKSECKKVVDYKDDNDDPDDPDLSLVCVDPDEFACIDKGKGMNCIWNTFNVENKRCLGDEVYPGSGVYPETVAVGYTRCENKGICWANTTGVPAKCIRGNLIDMRCELVQRGGCSAGSSLSSLSTLVTTFCYMTPFLVALL